MRSDSSLIILGLGPVGKAMLPIAAAQGVKVLAISKTTKIGTSVVADLGVAAGAVALQAALDQLPQATVVVTLPPLALHPQVLTHLCGMTQPLIVLGTTSSYLRTGSDNQQQITEDTPLDPQHKRFEVETQFMDAGATLCRLAGIYDQQRNPINWMFKGLIEAAPRQLNLVHTEDIAAAVVKLALAETKPPVINLSDGQHHTWAEIFERCQNQHQLYPPSVPKAAPKPDAFVDNGLAQQLFPEMVFRSFWEQLPLLVDSADSSLQEGQRS